jgi:stage III sporulation protein SpoIIIAA
MQCLRASRLISDPLIDSVLPAGVQLVATAHGNELENVVKNPSLADLVGGIQSVTLGDEEARK